MYDIEATCQKERRHFVVIHVDALIFLLILFESGLTPHS